MPESPCPGCGAPVRFRSSVSLLCVCPRCLSQVVRRDLDLQALGKVAALQPDGSPLQLFATGAYDGRPFTVLGRLQLGFPEGFWNEWFLDFSDGRSGWLGEAQGLYAVSFRVEDAGRLPAFAELALGRRLRVGGEELVVKDIRRAEYLSAQGELPFRPPLGEKVPVADLAGAGTRFGTLDYSEPAPILFMGHYREFDQLGFAGLKEIEGW